MPSDVLVPVLQSGISGVIAGILGGAGGAVFGVGRPWLVGLGAGAAGLGLAWLVLLREHRAGLWEIERITGRDLDGDGSIGRPSPKPREPMQIEVTERRETGRVKRMLYLDLGITDEQTLALARGLTEGKPLSQGAWTGSGNPLSRSQFDRVRDNLIARGLARWIDPKARSQGTELTPAGRAVMRRIAEQSRASTREHATGYGACGDSSTVG